MGIKNANLEPPVLALTLGSKEVTPLEMATGLRHPGQRRRVPRARTTSTGSKDRDGNVLFKQSTKPERAVSVQNARTVTQILTQVVQRGTGTAAQVPRWQVAGKTGSTDNNADAWFVGVTPEAGHRGLDGGAGRQRHPDAQRRACSPIVYGGTYPAMIYGTFMRQFLAGQTVVDFAAARAGAQPAGAEVPRAALLYRGRGPVAEDLRRGHRNRPADHPRPHPGRFNSNSGTGNTGNNNGNGNGPVSPPLRPPSRLRSSRKPP